MGLQKEGSNIRKGWKVSQILYMPGSSSSIGSESSRALFLSRWDSLVDGDALRLPTRIVNSNSDFCRRRLTFSTPRCCGRR
jgi:hypothetical protein